jgi:hypothetical protein
LDGAGINPAMRARHGGFQRTSERSFIISIRILSKSREGEIFKRFSRVGAMAPLGRMRVDNHSSGIRVCDSEP